MAKFVNSLGRLVEKYFIVRWIHSSENKWQSLILAGSVLFRLRVTPSRCQEWGSTAPAPGQRSIMPGCVAGPDAEKVGYWPIRIINIFNSNRRIQHRRYILSSNWVCRELFACEIDSRGKQFCLNKLAVRTRPAGVCLPMPLDNIFGDLLYWLRNSRGIAFTRGEHLKWASFLHYLLNVNNEVQKAIQMEWRNIKLAANPHLQKRLSIWTESKYLDGLKLEAPTQSEY